jgi:hypothetical protein
VTSAPRTEPNVKLFLPVTASSGASAHLAKTTVTQAKAVQAWVTRNRGLLGPRTPEGPQPCEVLFEP